MFVVVHQYKLNAESSGSDPVRNFLCAKVLVRASNGGVTDGVTVNVRAEQRYNCYSPGTLVQAGGRLPVSFLTSSL